MENKIFTIKKSRPGNVLFKLASFSNPALQKEFFLTERLPQVKMPLDWALSIFIDEGVYSLLEQGYFTIENYEALIQAATEEGIYFGEELDIENTKDFQKDILDVLKKGKRAEILKITDTYGQERVQEVAFTHLSELTMSVIKVLEDLWKIQLKIDEE